LSQPGIGLFFWKMQFVVDGGGADMIHYHSCLFPLLFGDMKKVEIF